MMSPTAHSSEIPRRGPGGVVRRYGLSSKRRYDHSPPSNIGVSKIGQYLSKRAKIPPSRPISALDLTRPETGEEMKERRERVVKLTAAMREPRSHSHSSVEGRIPINRAWLPSLMTQHYGGRGAVPSLYVFNRQPLPALSAGKIRSAQSISPADSGNDEPEETELEAEVAAEEAGKTEAVEPEVAQEEAVEADISETEAEAAEENATVDEAVEPEDEADEAEVTEVEAEATEDEVAESQVEAAEEDANETEVPEPEAETAEDETEVLEPEAEEEANETEIPDPEDEAGEEEANEIEVPEPVAETAEDDAEVVEPEPEAEGDEANETEIPEPEAETAEDETEVVEQEPEVDEEEIAETEADEAEAAEPETEVNEEEEDKTEVVEPDTEAAEVPDVEQDSGEAAELKSQEEEGEFGHKYEDDEAEVVNAGEPINEEERNDGSAEDIQNDNVQEDTTVEAETNEQDTETAEAEAETAEVEENEAAVSAEEQEPDGTDEMNAAEDAVEINEAQNNETEENGEPGDYDILVIDSGGELTDEEQGEHEVVEEAAEQDVPEKEEADNELEEQPGSEAEPAEAPVDERMAPYVELVQVIRGGSEEEQLAAVKRVRKHLSGEGEHPVDEYLESGVLPPLRACLDKQHNPRLQFEALWVLTNIASGTSEQTKTVVDADCVPAFLRLLSSSSAAVKEQAVWALGNILGDSAELRDRVLEEGAVPRLYDLVPGEGKEDKAPSNLSWTFTNIFRHQPWRLEDEQLAMCRKALNVFFNLNGDKANHSDALWCLVFMTNGGEEHVRWAVEAGFVPKLMEVLLSGQREEVKPALQVIRNMLKTTEIKDTVAKHPDLVMSVLRLTASKSASIRLEAVKVMDIIISTRQPEILTAALDADLATGLAIMTQMRDAVSLQVGGNGTVVVAQDCTPEQLAVLVKDDRYIMALRQLLDRTEDDLVLNGLRATLTALQRCVELKLDTAELDTLLSSERMAELTHHEDSNVRTLAIAGVAHYQERLNMQAAAAAAMAQQQSVTVAEQND